MQGQYHPGTDHWRQAEFDHRPAQVYAEAMIAAQVQRLGAVAAILARLSNPRRSTR